MHYESNCKGVSKTCGEDGKFAIHIFFISRSNRIIISVLFPPINILLLIILPTLCFENASMSMNVFYSSKNRSPKESGFF
jgi:hypothetical protein